MGLLQPHVRHGRRHGAADMNEASGALGKGAGRRHRPLPHQDHRRRRCRRQAGAGACRLQRADRRRRWSPTRPASRAFCRPSPSLRETAPRSSCCPIWDVPRARADARDLACGRSPRKCRSCCRGPVHFIPAFHRRRGQARHRRAQTRRRGRARRTSATTRGGKERPALRQEPRRARRSLRRRCLLVGA